MQDSCRPTAGGGIIGSDAGQAVEAASEAESAGRGSTEETEAETNPTVLFLFSHGFADRVQFRPSLGFSLDGLDCLVLSCAFSCAGLVVY